MSTVDQTISEDFRNRHADESFDGKPAPLTDDEWEHEYAEFCNEKSGFREVDVLFNRMFGVN